MTELTYITNLSAMFYLVPSVVLAFVLLIVGAALNIASFASVRCPVCYREFETEDDLKKHMKEAEGEGEGARVKEVA